MGKKSEVQDQADRYQSLMERHKDIEKAKLQVEAELAASKRELKKLMQQATDAGFDPNNLKEDIQRKQQVLAVKLDNFEADLSAAEQIIHPMLREIQGS
jgi:septal ring factor EnvC (AmiA/AmiB activator)